jgi:hypothetical protein
MSNTRPLYKRVFTLLQVRTPIKELQCWNGLFCMAYGVEWGTRWECVVQFLTGVMREVVLAADNHSICILRGRKQVMSATGWAVGTVRTILRQLRA